MLLVRLIVTSSSEQEYKNLYMFFNINGVGKIIYGYNSTFVHRGYNNTLCTMKEIMLLYIVVCGHHYVLLKNLKHFISWICIDEFHSFTSVEVWTHGETETCFWLYWNATLLQPSFAHCCFSQPPIPSASLPPIVHESAAAWSEHKHFSVSTWFCFWCMQVCILNFAKPQRLRPVSVGAAADPGGGSSPPKLP